jgi:hypothetical protein
MRRRRIQIRAGRNAAYSESGSSSREIAHAKKMAIPAIKPLKIAENRVSPIYRDEPATPVETRSVRMMIARFVGYIGSMGRAIVVNWCMVSSLLFR